MARVRQADEQAAATDTPLVTRVDQRIAAALTSGDLVPIDTDCEIVGDTGVDFIVRIVTNLRRKDASGARRPRDFNPFLPYDPAMFVADLPPRHVALLNKFPVLDRHLLIVTRDFEDQRVALTRADFEALWAVLAEFGDVGFYNGGGEAGASQRHKHLQVVPLPLADGVEGVPIEAALGPPASGCARAPGLPFEHALTWLAGGDPVDPAAAPGVCLQRYAEMLARLGLGQASERELPPPYNLLVTTRWMLMVPRGREGFESISVNALGYAGALLVRTRQQVDRLREAGPMRVLAALAKQETAAGNGEA